MQIQYPIYDEDSHEVEEKLDKNGEWCRWEDVNQLRIQYNKLLRKYKELKDESNG